MARWPRYRRCSARTVAPIPRSDPRLDVTLVTRIYEGMLRTRVLDDRMLALQRQGRIGFHIGCRGEEAAIIASAAALRETDWIFPCYRELGALLWRGFPLQHYIDNMFGNVDDHVQGRQMPDHVTGKRYRFALGQLADRHADHAGGRLRLGRQAQAREARHRRCTSATAPPARPTSTPG